MSLISITDKTHSATYQPGVDGLRCIAVLLVLVFHAGFDVFPGGFIGVDVFFVISGYLITGIIFTQIDKEKFSFINFMFSRISRLYPSLLFTLLFVFIGCFLIYSPADFMNVQSSAVYALLSASNIFFANRSGYFDTSSEINPLLHTWSLGVEQQFYLVWPLLILSVFFVKRSLVPILLIAVSIMSLLASQWATTNMQTEGYYWMPFRVFELSFGGIAFFIAKSYKFSSAIKEIMMTAGLVLIVGSAIVFSSGSQFPGYNAMIPVSGAILCILSHDSRFVGKIVTNKVSVRIGLISYSIYLIHWPLIVFYKYWIFREITNIEKASIIAISIIMAFFMYELIENKYRKINLLALSKQSIAIYSLSIALMSAFVFSINSNGFEWRVVKKAEDSNSIIKNHDYGGDGIKQNIKVNLGNKNISPSFVIMGDSYSRQYANAISENLIKTNKSAVGFFSDGCFFSQSVEMIESGKIRQICLEMTNKAVQFAKDKNIPLVYAQSWTNYMDKLAQEKRKISFANENEYINFNIENIISISKSIHPLQIYIIGTPPPSVKGINSSIESCLQRPDFLLMPCRERFATNESSDPKFRSNNEMDKAFKFNSKIKFINPYKYFCQNGTCNSVDDTGEPLYFDATHLSYYGARKIWAKIMSDINI
ncbi:acyltransferase family protein [Escherichia marmotae]|uniref:acyltransferase family protein n=1 Tax=Escherichia marmotae TaxID=1499973 RepID=UPI002FF3AF6E